jgi:hypothetical protein
MEVKTLKKFRSKNLVLIIFVPKFPKRAQDLARKCGKCCEVENQRHLKWLYHKEDNHLLNFCVFSKDCSSNISQKYELGNF